MSVPTDEQQRVIGNLVAQEWCARAEVRPLADDSREVWCYTSDNVLRYIYTVFVGGNVASRPGFRVTDETWIGDPR